MHSNHFYAIVYKGEYIHKLEGDTFSTHYWLLPSVKYASLFTDIEEARVFLHENAKDIQPYCLFQKIEVIVGDYAS